MYLHTILHPLGVPRKCNPLTAGISAVGSLFGNALNYKSQQDNNRANLQLAKYQNDWNMKMWEKNNAYNSPAAQKERMLQAGLNPLGQDFTPVASQAVQSANMANQQAPQVDASSIGNSFSMAYNDMLAGKKVDSEIKLMESDSKLKQQQSITEMKKQGIISAQTAEQLVKNLYADKKYKGEASIMSSEAYKAQIAASFAGTREYQEIQKIIAEKDEKVQNAKMVKLQRQWFPFSELSKIRVNNATARQINELLPYQKLLTLRQANALVVGMYKTAQEISILEQDEFIKGLETYMKVHGHNSFNFMGADLPGLYRLFFPGSSTVKGLDSAIEQYGKGKSFINPKLFE